MPAYKHGKPTYHFSRRPLLVIVILVLAVLTGAYYQFVLKGSKTTLKNNNKPLVSTIKTSGQNTLIDKPTFTMSLPGAWKLTAQNWDNRYTAWQWSTTDPKQSHRWVEVFVDTIPADKAVNYMVPVSASDSSLQLGQISDNCVNFTQGARSTQNRPTYIPRDQATLPSRWQSVDFLCDNANYLLQVVGTSSQDGINTVAVAGPVKGAHKYFFLYDDSGFQPDFGIFNTILASFSAK